MKISADKPWTPLDFFYHLEESQPNATFLRQPSGDQWMTLTYAEAGQEIRRMASALLAMNLRKNAHIAILSKNCYHWIMADLAIMMAEMVSVPLYATLPSEGLNEVLRLGDVDALFVGKLDGWAEQQQGVPNQMPIIRFPQYAGNAEVTQGEDWNDLVAAHEPLQGRYQPDFDALWTILFTSGTTGTPKGVMHSYGNIAAALTNQYENDDFRVFEIEQPRMFSFLPLNHIAERTVVEMGCLMGGGSISFADTLDSFLKNLQDTQPHVFFAVPRIWTKFQQGVLEKMPQKRLNTLIKIPFLGNIVKRKIRKGLGLDACKTLITAASMTPEALKAWYRSIGLNLREAYGQTENMGGFSATPKNENKAGTVGKMLNKTQGKIDPDSGELLLKQPWIMQGYYKDPIQTAKTLTPDGWLHTGDRVEIDNEGWVRILGRVKDTFKTAKGEFIDPNPSEEFLSKNAGLDQICVTGMMLSQPIALCTLSDLGKKINPTELNTLLESELKELNKTLANHERICKIVLVKEAWTVENQLITPTLKTRRLAIHNFYEKQMMEWAAQDGLVIRG